MPRRCVKPLAGRPVGRTSGRPWPRRGGGVAHAARPAAAACGGFVLTARLEGGLSRAGGGRPSNARQDAEALREAARRTASRSHLWATVAATRRWRGARGAACGRCVRAFCFDGPPGGRAIASRRRPAQQREAAGGFLSVRRACCQEAPGGSPGTPGTKTTSPPIPHDGMRFSGSHAHRMAPGKACHLERRSRTTCPERGLRPAVRGGAVGAGRDVERETVVRAAIEPLPGDRAHRGVVGAQRPRRHEHP